MIVGNQITTDNPYIADMIMFPGQSQVMESYLYNQVANVASTLNDVGQKFMSTNRDVFERLNNSQMMLEAKALLRNTIGINNPNIVRYLYTLDAIQDATPYMQSYIMANPVMRELYNKQLCNGYSDTYIDIDPGTIGNDHYHYRRVVDGMMLEKDDEWVCNNYYEDLLGDDRDLDIYEKIDILSTWEVMNLFIKEGFDVSSPMGGFL